MLEANAWWAYLVLFLSGWLAGVINVLAGGGSFLTLPILIFLGLPAQVANGTNRVGILAQNLGASWSFRRHQLLERQWLLWAALPATLGAGLGSWLALQIPDEAFKKTLAFLMILITLWSLWDPLGGRSAPAGKTRRGLLVAAFFLVGIYGGFVQAGVGFLILAATSLAGLDLVKGNALKVLAVLVFTLLSLSIFAWQGKVHWLLGGVLALGNTLGGLQGARLTILKGHRWLKKVVTGTILLFALKLWFTG